MITITNASFKVALWLTMLLALSSCGPRPGEESEDILFEDAPQVQQLDEAKVLTDSNSYSLADASQALAKVASKLGHSNQNLGLVVGCAKDTQIRPALRAGCLLTLGKLNNRELSQESRGLISDVVKTALEDKDEKIRISGKLALASRPTLAPRDILPYFSVSELHGYELSIQFLFLSRIFKNLSPLQFATAVNLLRPSVNIARLQPFGIRAATNLFHALSESSFNQWLGEQCLSGEIPAKRYQCWRVAAYIDPTFQIEGQGFPTLQSPAWQTFESQEPLNANILKGQVHD